MKPYTCKSCKKPHAWPELFDYSGQDEACSNCGAVHRLELNEAYPNGRVTLVSPRTKPKCKRGFASMDPVRRAQIQRMGGIAVQRIGTGHRFNSEEARTAGRIGGSRQKKKGQSK